MILMAGMTERKRFSMLYVQSKLGVGFRMDAGSMSKCNWAFLTSTFV